jgi:hypothetical protein
VNIRGSGFWNPYRGRCVRIHGPRDRIEVELDQCVGELRIDADPDEPPQHRRTVDLDGRVDDRVVLLEPGEVPDAIERPDGSRHVVHGPPERPKGARRVPGEPERMDERPAEIQEHGAVPGRCPVDQCPIPTR